MCFLSSGDRWNGSFQPHQRRFQGDGRGNRGQAIWHWCIDVRAFIYHSYVIFSLNVYRCMIQFASKPALVNIPYSTKLADYSLTLFLDKKNAIISEPPWFFFFFFGKYCKLELCNLLYRLCTLRLSRVQNAEGRKEIFILANIHNTGW